MTISRYADELELPADKTMPHNHALHVTVCKTWDEVSRLAQQWEQLLARSEVSTAFLTYEWVEAWWIAFGKSREPYVLQFLTPNGECVGIAPLYRISRRKLTNTTLPLRMLRFLGTGTGGATTSLGLIMRRGYEEIGACQFLDWLSRAHAEWDLLDLQLMPTEWLSTRVLLEELRVRGWFYTHSQVKRYCVPLPDKYSTYINSLSKNMRTQLPYKRRRLLKQYEVDVFKVCTQDELQPALEELFRLHSQRWQARGERGVFGRPERRVFAQEMAKRFLLRGWLDLWLLKLDGRTVAVEYGFRKDGMYHFLWAGLDTDLQAGSAGTLLKSYVMQQLIRDRVRLYDFMQGDEPYKMYWGPEIRTYSFVLCAAPYSIGDIYLRASAWHSAARKHLSSLPHRCKEGLRCVVPAGIWNFMRVVYKKFR